MAHMRPSATRSVSRVLLPCFRLKDFDSCSQGIKPRCCARASSDKLLPAAGPRHLQDPVYRTDNPEQCCGEHSAHRLVSSLDSLKLLHCTRLS